MDQPKVISLGQGEAALFCAPSPLREGPNEDAAVVVHLDARRAVLAVADGMGGMPAGAQAATGALRAVEGAVRAAVDREPGGLRAAILDGFEAANERVAASGVGAGTTLAVVEVDAGVVRPYHVGDSEILVVGQRGRLRFRTVSHSPVGYAVEAGLIDASDALHHEDRHLVSNFVGSPAMRIDIGPAIELRPRDTVVIGSDGLFDNLHLEEVVERVRKGRLADAAEAIATACRARMLEPEPHHPSKADDLTFILYRPDPRARPA